ncbi:NUDIX hydrolase [Elizabethkingia bruuniana]|uniref:NUDIX hydrolase n=1 Tax=Elizabethkingia bruuniana TaxID=1756149 RepID=UPI00099A88F3|nr:NUDIX domain-containing protein [Elizabethkingia bruuniana]OPC52429.1 NUDIX hydrolase [Elizabethkingia bruuniana]OPC60419.1 NUDIX hydrolase [Elizabethkingia bruuniana]RBI89796.1 NUDIX domain-containing protein [Elizabethkingia miricola]
MLNLQFCPSCGKESLTFNGRKMHCASCDFVFYNNTAAAVAVVIKCGDEVMLTRRNQEPSHGKLDLAGGFIDFEETAENACRRELFEEMQIEVDESKLKYICSIPNTYPYKGILYHTMDLFFEYEVAEKFDVVLEEHEISDTIWIKKNEIDLNEIAFESQKLFFEKYRLQ